MSEAEVPVAILVRVSTVKQETQRQISELQYYASHKGYKVVEICREIVSGGADEDSRHALRHVQDLARQGKIKKVLVHEISRLARRNSVAHRFVEALEDCGVSLYWHAQGIETLLSNGKRNRPRALCWRYSRKWREARLNFCGNASNQVWRKPAAMA